MPAQLVDCELSLPPFPLPYPHRLLAEARRPVELGRGYCKQRAPLTTLIFRLTGRPTDLGIQGNRRSPIGGNG